MKPRSTLAAGFAVALIVLAAGFAVGFRALQEARAEADSVRHTFEVMESIEELRSELAEAETAKRGFLISGEETYLAPYQRAVREIGPTRARLRRLTLDSPLQQRRLDALEAPLGAKLTDLAETIALRRAEGLEAAAARVRAGRSKALMDALRGQLAAMLAAERRLLTARQEAAQGADRVANRLMLGGVLGGALVVLVALWLTLRGVAAGERARGEAERGRQLLESVLASMSDGVVVVDGAGRFTHWTAAAERILGLGAGETTRPGWGERYALFRADGQTPCPPGELPLSRAMRGAVVREEELLVRDPALPGGMWLSASAQPLPGGTGAVMVMRDVTERRAAEQALAEREAELHAIFDSAADAIIAIDEQGTIERFNPAAEALFGFSAAEAIGRNVRLLMPEPYRSEHDGYLARYHETGEARIIGIGREVEGRHADGSTFPAELSVAETVLGARRLFTGIVRDISERKAVERMKNEFISTVSHELRTPLTSILGSLGLIRSGVVGELPGRAAEMIGIAHSNAERLVRLVNDMLDIEKIESGRLELRREPLALGALVDEVLAANQGYAREHGVRYALGERAEEAWVEGDRDALAQVLTNLLSNATKFSPPGAEVAVDVERRAGRVRVAVRDRGPGIPEAFRGQIFTKFAQADSSDARAKAGTGLGLNISKALVERHAGAIGFDTEPGVGSTFWFELDEHAPPAAPVCVAPGAASVLIVEDDADVARVIHMLLEQAGIRADVVGDAATARRMLARGRYAALTLDLALPGEDGLSLLRELREDPVTRELPVVVVSASASEGQQILNGDAVRVLDWMDKPIDPERLLGDLRLALEGVGDGPVRVLHVEDDPDVARVVEALIGERAEVTRAASLAEARRAAAAERFDLLVLDLELPDGRGETLLGEVRGRHGGRPPVVVFSAQEAGAGLAREVEAALLKTRTSNEELLATIQALIGKVNAEGEQ